MTRNVLIRLVSLSAGLITVLPSLAACSTGGSPTATPDTAVASDSTLTGHTGKVNTVAFSPNGKMLASGSEDMSIRLWDITDRRQIGEPLTGHTGTVFSVSFSPDGKLLASGSGDNTVRLWDVATRQQIGEALTGHTTAVVSVRFSPDGTKLGSGDADASIRLWAVGTHRTLASLPLPGGNGSTHVAFSPDGHTLAGASSIYLRFWSLTNYEQIRLPIVEYNRGGINGIAFSPDGTMVGTVGGSRLQFYDPVTREHLGGPPEEEMAGGSWYGLAFSQDSRITATGGGDGVVRLFDTIARTPIGRPMRGSAPNEPLSVSLSPDATTLASAADATVRLWNVSAMTAGVPARPKTRATSSPAATGPAAGRVHQTAVTAHLLDRPPAAAPCAAPLHVEPADQRRIATFFDNDPDTVLALRLFTFRSGALRCWHTGNTSIIIVLTRFDNAVNAHAYYAHKTERWGHAGYNGYKVDNVPGGQSYINSGAFGSKPDSAGREPSVAVAQRGDVTVEIHMWQKPPADRTSLERLLAAQFALL